MPNLLAVSDYDCSEPNEVTSPDDPEPIDPTAPDDADDNSSHSDKETSCNIPECDYSKPVNEDEVSLFLKTQENINEASDDATENLVENNCDSILLLFINKNRSLSSTIS